MTYLDDYKTKLEKGVVYVPIGTVEWHGNHLPLETDFMVAQKICEMVSKKYPGFILPPIYLGGDKFEITGGKELRGIERYTRTKLPGNIYFVKPEVLKGIIKSLAENLINEGFKKVIFATGHAGSGHRAVLEEVAKELDQFKYINIYEGIGESKMLHAGKEETSLFWALFPEAKFVPDKPDADLVKLLGYNPPNLASEEEGKKLLEIALNNFYSKLS